MNESADVEVERKFLVESTAALWSPLGMPDPDQGSRIEQGYLYKTNARTMRFRFADDQLTLSIKWPRFGMHRTEKEILLPREFTDQLLRFCEPHIIRKTRYPIVHAEHLWTVDVFEGQNSGLVLAEVELNDPRDAVQVPDWCGREVTDDPRFYNDYLAEHPYNTWA